MATLNATTETAAPAPLDSPDSLPAPRLHFIDGLRGLAMLMVMAFHCWLFGGMWFATLQLGSHRLNMAPLLGLGSTGVNLFLVLSGFCLYWPFVKGGARREPTLAEFARKRCRRILPPYYVTLILFGTPLFFQALHHHSRSELSFAWNWMLLHVVMLHNLNPKYVVRVDGPLWTLALESQLYVLFPLLVEGYRRFNARGLLLAVLVASAVYRSFVWQGQLHPPDYVPDYGNGFVLAPSVFGRCFEFALGMFCAILVARWHTEQKSPLRRSDYLLFLVIVTAGLLDQLLGGFQILNDSMWGLLYAALLLAASRPHGALHRVLSHRALVTLGVFSYSVYLIHQPLVIQMTRFAARHFTGVEQVLFAFGLVVPVMLTLGYGFHLVFERPFMNGPRARKPDAGAPKIVFAPEPEATSAARTSPTQEEATRL